MCFFSNGFYQKSEYKVVKQLKNVIVVHCRFGGTDMNQDKETDHERNRRNDSKGTREQSAGKTAGNSGPSEAD